MLQQVIHKEEDSAINYIKIFQNSKALEISVENSYTDYQLIRNFLDHFRKIVKYSTQIASHQAELIRE